MGIVGVGVLLLLLGTGLLSATFARSGGKRGPTEDELRRAIDQRLADRGLAPLPGVAASASASASGTKRRTDPATASQEFLAKLDALMADYKPDLPIIEDKSDVLRCVTSDASKNDTDISKAVSAMKGKADEAKRERQRREKEFYAGVFPLAFRVDYDWATRKSKPIAGEYCCYNVTYSKWTRPCLTPETCLNNPYSGMANFEWRARVPARPSVFLYSKSEKPPTDAPELMRRMSAAGLKVPARFSCRVEDVVPVGARRSITCRGAVGAEIHVSGPLAPINIGDVISAPLFDVKRDPDGVLFKDVGSKTPVWTVDADGSTVTVDVAASCPTADEILATGGVAPAPSASASAPEALSAAPKPAAAPKAACKQCFFNATCAFLVDGSVDPKLPCCRPIPNPDGCPEP